MIDCGLNCIQQMAFGRWPHERTLGGEPGRGQDATIILIPKGGSRDRMLALIHLHSHVLSTHSKYFNTCLSERWENSASPSSASMEFLLEVQTDVQYYFDCFSNMYSPFAKSFESVKRGVELLKVASQIDFQGLMERISLYLSCMLWTKEDQIRVREYAASPDFPRIHLVDLVSRLGLDAQSEEDRQKQLSQLIREYARAALKAASTKGLVLPLFLQGIGCGPPSEFSRWIFAIVSEEAKDMFRNIGTLWNIKVPDNSNFLIRTTGLWRIQAMYWILEALLSRQVAEELVQTIVHLESIPKYLCTTSVIDSSCCAERQKFAELVLVMYQEVAAGRLLLRPPERFALLVNWHVMMKTCLKEGSFEQATTNLFLTLPVKQQTKFIKWQTEKAYDVICTVPLLSLLQSHGGLGQPEC